MSDSALSLTGTQAVALVRGGARPVVEFGKECVELDSYPEPGMWARLVGGREGRDAEIVHLEFDFSEFEERNRTLETASFNPAVGGSKPRTAREAGYYQPQMDFVFDAGGSTKGYFVVQNDAATALFRAYVERGGPATHSYVAWLEEALLATDLGRTYQASVQRPQQPTDTCAETSPRASLIELHGPFSAKDCKGRVWGVKGLYVHKEDHIADIFVRLDRPGVHDASLYDDRTFLSCVHDALKSAGYGGPVIGRAELGMQTDECVVLEPGQEFHEWVVTKGFVLLS